MKRARSQTNEAPQPPADPAVAASFAAIGFALAEPHAVSRDHQEAAKHARVYGLVAALTYRVPQFKPDVEPNPFFLMAQKRRDDLVKAARLLDEMFVAYNATPPEQRKAQFGKRGDPTGELTLEDVLRMRFHKPAIAKYIFGLRNAALLWPTLWLAALPQVSVDKPEEQIISTPGIFEELAEYPEEVARVERVWRNEWGVQDAEI